MTAQVIQYIQTIQTHCLVQVWQCTNKANLRDFIAVTSLIISLKWDSNRRFYGLYDLKKLMDHLIKQKGTTDGQTDRWTDRCVFRTAWSQLKYPITNMNMPLFCFGYLYHRSQKTHMMHLLISVWYVLLTWKDQTKVICFNIMAYRSFHHKFRGMKKTFHQFEMKENIISIFSSISCSRTMFSKNYICIDSLVKDCSYSNAL